MEPHNRLVGPARVQVLAENFALLEETSNSLVQYARRCCIVGISPCTLWDVRCAEDSVTCNLGKPRPVISPSPARQLVNRCFCGFRRLRGIILVSSPRCAASSALANCMASPMLRGWRRSTCFFQRLPEPLNKIMELPIYVYVQPVTQITHVICTLGNQFSCFLLFTKRCFS